MPPEDSPTAKRPPPIFSWPETALFTIWVSVLVAVCTLAGPLELMDTLATELRNWALSIPLGRWWTLLVRISYELAPLGVVLWFLASTIFRIRCRPAKAGRDLRIVCSLLVVLTLCNQGHAWMDERDGELDYLGNVIVFSPLELARFDTERVTSFLFPLWLLLVSFIATYEFDWRVQMHLAAQRLDASRRFRLLAALEKGGPAPWMAARITLAVLMVPCALAVGLTQLEQRVRWMEQRVLWTKTEFEFPAPTLVSELTEQDEPAVPLRIVTNRGIELGGDSHLIADSAQVAAFRTLAQNFTQENRKPTIAVSIAPDATHQEIISVLDRLKRAGLHRIVILDIDDK